MFVAGIGIAWMYAREFSAAARSTLLGTLVALAVPIAAAINWAIIQHSRAAADLDLLPAVLIGAVLSALLTLPLSPAASRPRHTMSGWLALLGVAQLAIPCLIAVAGARAPSAHPRSRCWPCWRSIFGVAWPWVGGHEVPSAAVLTGGSLVVGALAVNEALALRRARAQVAVQAESLPISDASLLR